MRAGATSRTANIHGVVKSLRIRELQVVLGDLNLSRSGRKQELVDRIVNSLEQFELKANENASNHATSAYYNDQLTAGLRSLDTQYRLTHHGQSLASAVAIAAVAPPQMQNGGGGYATPPPSMPRTPPPPPPGAYGRPLPYPGHLHHPHSNPQHPHPHHTHRPPSHYPPPQLPPPAPAHHGNEVFIATTPPALDGARCLCGLHNSNSSTTNSSSSNGKIVTCVGCALRVHAKCHQLVACASTDEWYCEMCRASLCDPFLKVTRTLLAPVFVKFTRNQVPFRIEYTLSDADIAELYAKRDPKPGAMTAGCLELQLRCFALKEELGTGTSWPTTSVVVTNGFNMVLVQRAAPGQSNPSKVLREQPVSLFPCSRVGRNVVEVRTSENPLVFAFMVQIVEFQSVESLMNQVKHASADISYEQATREVVKSFGGGEDEDEEDDDAIVTTSTILSVRCPLGLCVIDLPARGVHCKHLQCFDLRTFLLFNKKARSRHYRCTVCHNFIKTADLRIDPYLKKLLADVQGDDELEEVELYPDATWKRRVNDDAASSPPPAKRLKQETGDAAATTGSTSTATAAATAGGATGASSSAAAAAGSASAPFEIDLSLSSDEDDDDHDDTSTDNGMLPFPSFGASAAAAPKTAASSTTSGTASTSTLSDDDVAIFTVDSDVWETNGGSGSGGSMMAFPLDLFSSFPSATTGSENGSWNASSSTAASNSSYGASSSSAPAATTATASSSASSSAWAATSRVTTSSSDAELASAMAQLSRNHPHVNNPFDRQPAASTASASAPRTGGGARGGGGGGGGGGGMMDVICLLDSDSDSD